MRNLVADIQGRHPGPPAWGPFAADRVIAQQELHGPIRAKLSAQLAWRPTHRAAAGPPLIRERLLPIAIPQLLLQRHANSWPMDLRLLWPSPLRRFAGKTGFAWCDTVWAAGAIGSTRLKLRQHGGAALGGWPCRKAASPEVVGQSFALSKPFLPDQPSFLIAFD